MNATISRGTPGSYISPVRIVMRHWALQWRECQKRFPNGALSGLAIERAKSWRNGALESESRVASGMGTNDQANAQARRVRRHGPYATYPEAEAKWIDIITPNKKGQA